MTRWDSSSPRERKRKSTTHDPVEAKGSNRDWVLLLVFVGIACLVCLRLVYLQVVKADEYSALAQAQRTSDIQITAQRGTIYDRNGNVLAMSVDAVTVYANPSEVADPQATADLLVEILGGSAEDYVAALEKDSSFVYLSKKADVDVGDRIDEEKAALSAELEEANAALEDESAQSTTTALDGIYYLADSKRVYPYGQIGGQIIGYVGTDNEGLSGLELMYDDILSGTDGELIVERGKGGIPVPDGVQTTIPAVDGQDIVISIDIDLQQYVEAQLVAVGEERSTSSGNATVIDGATGEIYASASLPLYDLNNVSDAEEGAESLKSITTSYEPGSTFKAVVVAAILEEHLMDTEDTLSVPGSLTIYDYTITDSHDHDTETMSLRTILAQSSNIGVSLLEQKLGDETFDEYLKMFRFGVKTGVDYPGESAGILADVSDWSAVQAANIAFGQGIATSSLQVASFYGALSNEGILNQPHFLIDLPHSSDELSYTSERVVSTETASKLSDMLSSVVSEGTGSSAAIEGYTVAGKTGTAQKVLDGGGYSDSDYVVSFVGYLPYTSSNLVCLTSMDNPTGADGSSPTGPLFSSIMSFAATRYMIEPDKE